jgi:hypothetical protein
MNQQNSKTTASEEDKEWNASGGGQVVLGFEAEVERETSVNK